MGARTNPLVLRAKNNLNLQRWLVIVLGQGKDSFSKEESPQAREAS
jgi:hypothetical protein